MDWKHGRDTQQKRNRHPTTLSPNRYASPPSGPATPSPAVPGKKIQDKLSKLFDRKGNGQKSEGGDACSVDSSQGSLHRSLHGTIRTFEHPNPMRSPSIPASSKEKVDKSHILRRAQSSHVCTPETDTTKRNRISSMCFPSFDSHPVSPSFGQLPLYTKNEEQLPPSSAHSTPKKDVSRGVLSRLTSKEDDMLSLPRYEKTMCEKKTLGTHPSTDDVEYAPKNDMLVKTAPTIDPKETWRSAEKQTVDTRKEKYYNPPHDENDNKSLGSINLEDEKSTREHVPSTIPKSIWCSLGTREHFTREHQRSSVLPPGIPLFISFSPPSDNHFRSSSRIHSDQGKDDCVTVNSFMNESAGSMELDDVFTTESTNHHDYRPVEPSKSQHQVTTSRRRRQKLQNLLPARQLQHQHSSVRSHTSSSNALSLYHVEQDHSNEEEKSERFAIEQQEQELLELAMQRSLQESQHMSQRSLQTLDESLELSSGVFAVGSVASSTLMHPSTRGVGGMHNRSFSSSHNLSLNLSNRACRLTRSGHQKNADHSSSTNMSSFSSSYSSLKSDNSRLSGAQSGSILAGTETRYTQAQQQSGATVARNTLPSHSTPGLLDSKMPSAVPIKSSLSASYSSDIEYRQLDHYQQMEQDMLEMALKESMDDF